MVNIDRKRRLITLEISGFSNEAAVSESSAKIENAIQLLLIDGNYFDVLVIFQNASPTSREGSKVMGAMLERMVAIGLRRSALVTDSALVKLQVRRLSDLDERFGYFEDLNAADEWLKICAGL